MFFFFFYQGYLQDECGMKWWMNSPVKAIDIASILDVPILLFYFFMKTDSIATKRYETANTFSPFEVVRF